MPGRVGPAYELADALELDDEADRQDRRRDQQGAGQAWYAQNGGGTATTATTAARCRSRKPAAAKYWVSTAHAAEHRSRWELDDTRPAKRDGRHAHEQG
jgi:hypothetical protein